METDIAYCSRKIAEEEQRAKAAPGPEAAEVHLQLAMLYKAQLNVLTRRLRSLSTKDPAARAPCAVH